MTSFGKIKGGIVLLFPPFDNCYPVILPIPVLATVSNDMQLL
jgi:hypothetical protein